MEEELSPLKDHSKSYSERLKEVRHMADQQRVKRLATKQQEQCLICLSSAADAVIGPCGHGGLCFACCQTLIADVIAKQPRESSEPTHYILSQGRKVYNFRCHLCRMIGLRVYQVTETSGKQEDIVRVI